MRAWLWIFIVLYGLAGCTETPKTLRIAQLPDRKEGNWPTWPRGDQVPRFVYVGDLTGEANFGADDEATTRGFLAWLVGLGQEVHEPTVLRRPQGVVEAGDGRIWVTDVSRQAVFLFDTAAGELRVLETTDQGNRFLAPIGLAPAPNGDILVADAELGYLTRFSPDGEAKARIGEGVLQRPTGVAVDQATGRIYVADTRANHVQVFDENGRALFQFGSEGEASGQLNAPTYLSIAAGRVYVTDTLNARVQVFDTDGKYLRQFGDRGLYVGNLSRPKGISVSEDGLVYVVESYYDHLLVFDADGRFLLPIGGAGQGPGQFFLPSGVWAGMGGRVYVADMFNGRVSVFQYLGDG